MTRSDVICPCLSRGCVFRVSWEAAGDCEEGIKVKDEMGKGEREGETDIRAVNNPRHKLTRHECYNEIMRE